MRSQARAGQGTRPHDAARHYGHPSFAPCLPFPAALPPPHPTPANPTPSVALRPPHLALQEIMRDYIQKHPELNISEEGITKSTLTKAERQLKDKFDGRPTKPPP